MAGLNSGAAVFGEFAAYPAVVLLCAVLPFAVSFVIDAVNLMLRRERSAIPALVTALVLSFVVAATGFLLLQLGLVRIGSGRDAADVALCTAFGFANPNNQNVQCEVLSNDFQPLTEDQLRTTAISLDAPMT